MKITKFHHKVKITRLSHVFLLIFVATLYVAVIASLTLASVSNKLLVKAQKSMQAQAEMITHFNSPTYTPAPTKTPTPSPKPKAQDSWGVAKQVDKTTWTMKVGEDEKMASASDIFNALNYYRSQNGAGALSWDDRLAEFAKKRVNTFISIGGLDSHAGFNEYFKNQDNMKNMGLTGVGENSSYGYKMEGVHLIEWVFAGDAPHNNNQLDKSWNTVGIAVSGTAVDLVFGKK